MERYCGSILPPTIVSPTNSLFVIFFSDDNINGAGFNATYMSIEGEYFPIFMNRIAMVLLNSQGLLVVISFFIKCNGGSFSLFMFYVCLWSTSELRVRLVPLNRFKPSSKIFY